MFKLSKLLCFHIFLFCSGYLYTADDLLKGMRLEKDEQSIAKLGGKLKGGFQWLEKMIHDGEPKDAQNKARYQDRMYETNTRIKTMMRELDEKIPQASTDRRKAFVLLNDFVQLPFYTKATMLKKNEAIYEVIDQLSISTDEGYAKEQGFEIVGGIAGSGRQTQLVSATEKLENVKNEIVRELAEDKAKDKAKDEKTRERELKKAQRAQSLASSMPKYISEHKIRFPEDNFDEQIKFISNWPKKEQIALLQLLFMYRSEKLYSQRIKGMNDRSLQEIEKALKQLTNNTKEISYVKNFRVHRLEDNKKVYYYTIPSYFGRGSLKDNFIAQYRNENAFLEGFCNMRLRVLDSIFSSKAEAVKSGEKIVSDIERKVAILGYKNTFTLCSRLKGKLDQDKNKKVIARLNEKIARLDRGLAEAKSYGSIAEKPIISTSKLHEYDPLITGPLQPLGSDSIDYAAEDTYTIQKQATPKQKRISQSWGSRFWSLWYQFWGKK